MSLKVIKAGILDSIQDQGRNGYRRFGINPSGVMDRYCSRLANLLVGNPIHDAVVELHFPSSSFLFEKDAVIAITGADFSPTIDDQFIQLNETLNVGRNSVLRFTHHTKGARSYLAVAGGFELTKWLNSDSTHLKAGIGGFQGRRLMKDDVIRFPDNLPEIYTRKRALINKSNFDTDRIFVLPGNEWNWISEEARNIFLQNEYSISFQSDRMGYKLTGEKIFTTLKTDLVSSPVCFGTIQLLPDGNLIVLMADHQTTGGYPRIATVITTHHSILAQKKPGDSIRFELTDILTAEKLLFHKENELLSMASFNNKI